MRSTSPIALQDQQKGIILKITDVIYLSRERVKSTFMEDFRAFMESHVPVHSSHLDILAVTHFEAPAKSSGATTYLHTGQKH